MPRVGQVVSDDHRGSGFAQGASQPKTGTMAPVPLGLHTGDCIAELSKLPARWCNLAFADPPFNIGYSYDSYNDDRPTDEYLDWSLRWLQEVDRALTHDGTLWLAMGDNYVAELKCLVERFTNLQLRSWVIWYYTFGVNCTNKLSRSHTHLLYFVMDKKRFTFNAADPVNRVPSARQLIYNDKRANSRGRLPDDTWILKPGDWILRPQDVPEGFSGSSDTWHSPRVAGTFKEREGFHGCQMPQAILDRIIRLCSNPGDIVLDPFSGSATTLVSAKSLGRRYVGYDISEEYVKRGNERLSQVPLPS